jgi:hypothetical protein
LVLAWWVRVPPHDVPCHERRLHQRLFSSSGEGEGERGRFLLFECLILPHPFHFPFPDVVAVHLAYPLARPNIMGGRGAAQLRLRPCRRLRKPKGHRSETHPESLHERKNKKKGAHAAACDPPLASYDMTQATQSPLLSLSGPVPSKACRSRYPLRWDAGKVGDKAGNARELREAAETESLLPPPPPADLSLVKFAGEVDDHSRELLFKCPSRPLFPPLTNTHR